MERQAGSGRPLKITSSGDKNWIKSYFNHKTGVSQRKAAEKIKVCQKTVCNHLKRSDIKYSIRKKVPKVSLGQKQRQTERLPKLLKLVKSSSMNIVMDDEAYFTLDGLSMPGNRGFYSDNKENR